MSNHLSALKLAVSRPSFVVTLLVLGACAVSLNTAAAFLKVRFTKKPCQLRCESLSSGIPQRIGYWEMVSKDQSIDSELEQVLATSRYVFRDYVDSRKISDAELAWARSASGKDREAWLARQQGEHPASVLRVAVTFYTGMVDTVAHIPERCYVADGFEVKEREEHTAMLGDYADGSPRSVPYRFLGFEDRAGVGARVERVARNVAYTFHCDGEYVADPLMVRAHLQNLLEPYGYYAKIEMMTAVVVQPQFHKGVFEVNNHDESIAAMENFMAAGLPAIEKCLPDWAALHRPATPAAASMAR